MTEVEAFLANQEKFRCERMNGSLTVAQCTANKKSGKYFSCEMCKGLGERIDMGTKNTICTTDSCEKYAVRLGMCWKCCKANGIDPATGGKLETANKTPKKPAVKNVTKSVTELPAVSDTKAAAETSPTTELLKAIVANNTPTVSNAEQRESDEIAFLRQLFNQTMNTWSNDLHDAKSPRERAELYLKMCDAAEDPGY